MTRDLESQYDVVVVGGGAAGLNGALMLARSRRSVLVVDGRSPRNAAAAGVHGMLGHDGVPPAELLARGRSEVRSYGGHLVDGTVVRVERDEDGFTVLLADGRRTGARRVLVASGLVDELPSVDGVAQRWGRDVVHCPYCHGWEVRDRAIGVLASGPTATHSALLFRQLSDDVVLFAHDAPPTDDEAALLQARGVEIVVGEVAALDVVDDAIRAVRLVDGRSVAREVVAVGTRMHARVDFLAPLGLEAQPHPTGVGEHLVADAFGRTEVPGVWVAGNAVELSAQVGASAAAGATAGAQINAELVAEEAQAALAEHRSRAAAGG